MLPGSFTFRIVRLEMVRGRTAIFLRNCHREALSEDSASFVHNIREFSGKFAKIVKSLTIDPKGPPNLCQR